MDNHMQRIVLACTNVGHNELDCAHSELPREQWCKTCIVAAEGCKHCGQLHPSVPADLCLAARREYDDVSRFMTELGL